jgi:hypothetical protein
VVRFEAGDEVERPRELVERDEPDDVGEDTT